MRIYLDSIGCRLNQSEIEAMAEEFLQAGHVLAATPEESDCTVINTCTVTAAAAADSRAMARRLHRRNPHSRLVLTGCWITLAPVEAARLPGVTLLVPNAEKDSLVPRVLTDSSEASTAGCEPNARALSFRGRTRRLVKVQDGCDSACTYCATVLARGRSRSLPIERVIRSVQAAVQADIREVVLTGAQLSAYGRDLAPPLCLADLVRAILQDTNLPRLRLSSLEPWGISEGFFDLWSSSRLCRHLHLPLQSGCATTLRRMGRRTHPAHFAHLIASARAAIPGVAITTDLMVGFPGETDAEFAESLAFIEAQAFAGAHIFTFSARPGTPAALLPQPVPAKISRARSHLLRTSVEESANAFRRAFLGSVLTVLWETAAQTAGGWNLAGLSDNYLRVRATAPGDLKNRLLPVRIAGIQGHTLQGEMLPS